MSKPAPQPQTRPARAPFDEDVDDLDDLLEQFAAASSKAPAAAPSGSSSKAAVAAPNTNTNTNANTNTNTNTNANPTANATESQTRTDGAPGLGIDDLDLSDDFARELAAGMAALMREIAAEASAAGPAAEPGAARDGKDKDKAGAGAGTDKGVGAGGDWSETGEEERAREEAFRRTWEEMVTRAMDGVDSGAVPAGAEPKAKARTKEGVKAAEGTGAGAGTDAFQTSILKAMEKLRESESTLNSAPPADEDAALEQLLRSFGGAGLDGDGTDAGDDAQIQGVLEDMMAQLMSKDVLYEPLSELRDKFPGFLRDKGAALKAADRARFEGQQRVVREVVALFEDPAYAPENAVLGARVVALMNEMQSYGAPPTEIMGPLPPGLELGQDGLPALPDGCTIA